MVSVSPPQRSSWFWLDRLESYIALDMARFAAALLTLGTCVLWVWSFNSGPGLLDGLGRPIGTDFSSFWAAGHLAQAGHARDVYVPKLHFAAQQALFGPGYKDYYGFFYPPTFLLVSSALALLPYAASLLVWQAGGLAFYLAALRQALPKTRTMLVLACGFPAVFLALGHGQNSFLTTGLFTLGLVLRTRRPVWSGICFGLLAYKPQLALLVPVALLAVGNWRVIVAAGVTVIAYLGVTALVLGPDIYLAFLHLGPTTRVALLENGGPGWHKIMSLFAFLRSAGFGVSTAYAAQLVLTAACAVLVWTVWRRTVDDRLKDAVLVVASLLATPFVLDYDLLLLAPALAGFGAVAAARSWPRGDRLVLAFVFTAPLYARGVAEASLVPLGLISLLVFVWGLARQIQVSPDPATADHNALRQAVA